MDWGVLPWVPFRHSGLAEVVLSGLQFCFPKCKQLADHQAKRGH